MYKYRSSPTQILSVFFEKLGWTSKYLPTSYKLGCIFRMVISFEFRVRQSREDDYREDAPTLLFEVNCNFWSPDSIAIRIESLNIVRFWDIVTTSINKPVQRSPVDLDRGLGLFRVISNLSRIFNLKSKDHTCIFWVRVRSPDTGPVALRKAIQTVPALRRWHGFHFERCKVNLYRFYLAPDLSLIQGSTDWSYQSARFISENG